jgi:glycosyltransferase involved in cell wall biosynthesis
MKNVAVIMDVTSKSGGKLHMVLSICNYLKKIEDYNFIFITTFLDAKIILDKELKINCLLFNKNSFINRLLSKIKKKFHFLPFVFPFESFLKKKKVDLVYFLDSSPMVRNLEKINYIYTIFDLGHKISKKLPEYSASEIQNRDSDYLTGGAGSKKIIVGTNELKKQLIKSYKINKTKIEILKFPPPITNLKNIKQSFIQKKINKIITSEDYFIYPAQFWKHKNHSYIVEASKILKNKNKLNFKIIFTGHDKGYLQNIKNLIKNLNLNDNFIILNYVNDHELNLLYQNSLAVVVPTLVAPVTLPLYESFYFKKPIFYNSNILDPDFKKNVISLNIDDIYDFELKIKKLENKTFIKELTEYNFNSFKSLFNEEENIIKLKNLFFQSLA